MGKLAKSIQEMIDNTSDVLYREEIYINNVHEYDYHKLSAAPNATVHTLYFSDDDGWDDKMKKQVAMQLVDTGNGIEIIGLIEKTKLDYLEAEHLHILLRLSSSKSTYQICEPTPRKLF